MEDNTNRGLGKLPPQAPDMEEAVLGAIMLEKEGLLKVIDILSGASFYKNSHSLIYQSILDLFKNNDPINILSVTSKLRKNGALDQVGGAYMITDLTNKVTSSANIEFHARIIQQKFLAREMIRISTEAIINAYSDITDIFELINQTQTQTFNLVSNIQGKDIKPIKKLVAERIEDYKKKTNGSLSGLSSGFGNIDAITGGWQKTDLIIIAARPAMGKTALALQIAKNAAIMENTPVVIFSLEMSEKQLTDRLIASETGIFQEKLVRRQLSEYDFTKLDIGTVNLSNSKMFIDDTSGLFINSIRSKAIRLKQLHNIGLIVVDYLQLMDGVKDKGDNREQVISKISRSLKGLAKDLDIPVIALSQLSRAVESRPGNNKRPMLSDLRESGSIEQDADMVLFMYRPEYYGIEFDEANNSTAGLTEVIFAKNRQGACDTATLNFDGALMKFEDRI
jgi:replicative DNA helicase